MLQILCIVPALQVQTTRAIAAGLGANPDFIRSAKWGSPELKGVCESVRFPLGSRWDSCQELISKQLDPEIY